MPEADMTDATPTIKENFLAHALDKVGETAGSLMDATESRDDALAIATALIVKAEVIFRELGGKPHAAAQFRAVFDAEAKDTAQPSVEGLIAKLEAAPEGSRRLDGDIAETLGLQMYGAPRMWGIAGDAGFALSAGHTWIAPRYTTSIDAALTLVPKGAVWHVMTDYGDLNRAKVGPHNNPSASVYRDADRPLFMQADAATPALALCIAALKARHAVPQTGFGDEPQAPNTDESNNNTGGEE